VSLASCQSTEEALLRRRIDTRRIIQVDRRYSAIAIEAVESLKSITGRNGIDAVLMILVTSKQALLS